MCVYVVYLTFCVPDPPLYRSPKSRSHPRGRHCIQQSIAVNPVVEKTSVQIHPSDYSYRLINKLTVKACSVYMYTF